MSREYYLEITFVLLHARSSSPYLVAYSSTMPNTQKTIALAGVGSLGEYIYEELTADDRFSVVVISRQVST